MRGGGSRNAVNTWGLGYEYPLNSTVQLGVEMFGEDHLRPDKQIGLRWEVSPGLKWSLAIGRGNGRRFGNAGLAWEF